MTTHIVYTENYTCYFIEINGSDIRKVNHNCMQINGQADSISDFVKNSGIESYFPFGYVLRLVYRVDKNSKNFTAFLYKLGAKFFD